MGEGLVSWEDLARLDIRVGTVLEARAFPAARRPAYQLRIDFGDPLGIRWSSAQITERYSCEDLAGSQVVCVVNFPPKRIAGFMSACLVLGVYAEGGVVLLRPGGDVPNGSKVG